VIWLDDPTMKHRASLLLAYLLSGLVLGGALMVFVVDAANAPQVLLAGALALGVLASAVAVLHRRQALRAQANATAGAQTGHDNPGSRQAHARHPGLGPGLLSLEADTLRFEAQAPARPGMLAYCGLDLYRAGPRQVITRAFSSWFARSRLRTFAAQPRRLVIARRDIVACAGFERMTKGPELVIGHRPAGKPDTDWDVLFLVRPTPGRFPEPSDLPDAWVTALQPAAAESRLSQAARARRRIHNRLALAEAALGASAAAIPLLVLILLLLAAAVFGNDPLAVTVALILAGIGLLTSATIAVVAWLSYL
jgi:hypothetical protein